MSAPTIEPIEVWTDGSGTVGTKHAALGVVVVRAGLVVAEASHCFGLGTNNDAEVRALGRGLALARAIGGVAAPVTLYADSEFALGACAPGSAWKVRRPELARLIEAARRLAGQFATLRLVHVKGHSGVALNERADALAGRARRAAVAASAAAEGAVSP